jgi:hypothetical protein
MDQRREMQRKVNIMRQIKDKNPHVVQLYEVLASKTKIYLVRERPYCSGLS